MEQTGRANQGACNKVSISQEENFGLPLLDFPIISNRDGKADARRNWQLNFPASGGLSPAVASHRKATGLCVRLA